MRRTVVTGAKGLLGGSVAARPLEPGFAIIACQTPQRDGGHHSESGYLQRGFDFRSEETCIDLSDVAVVKALLAR